MSRTGVCLRLGRRFEPAVALRVEIRGGGGTLTLLARVCWSRRAAQGTWAVGCAFGRPLTDGEMSTLLASEAATVDLHHP